MNLRSTSAAAASACALLLLVLANACSDGSSASDAESADELRRKPRKDASASTEDASTSAPPPATDASTAPLPGEPPPPSSAKITVALEPQVASSSVRRIDFAVPLPPNMLTSADAVQVRAQGVPLPTARRALATWPGGSLRSIQIQIDLAVPAATTVEVSLGEAASAGALPLVPVEQTLVVADGTSGPAVWAVLPASWLATSRIAGPAVPSAQVAGTSLAAWDRLCDYARWGTAAFNPLKADAGSWLYDRPTAFYRGYQRTGAIAALRSAYVEAAMYRAGLAGTGSATRIAVPGASADLKYHYAQGLALHYLLTGDDRFREAAENVAIRAHDLWTSPGYAGGADFWTERHAGFALLAYEWAAAVSDDRASTFAGWANEAVRAYLDLQATYPVGYANADERCFAHSAEAHGEDYGYFGCSPWMSAILADGLDAYADRLARSGDAAGAQAARASLVRLGRFVAKQGRDAAGKPFYWAGAGVTTDEVDDYEEHWGESAYVVALAWYSSGKTEAALRTAADQLVSGFGTRGEVGQLRSFNWQCRSAVMTPFLLQP